MMIILLGWIIALLSFLKFVALLLRRGQGTRDGAGLIPERSKASPDGIVAGTSNLEKQPLGVSDIKHGAPEKEMPNNNTPHSKYDVFVSFRGEDIRDGFLSHLVKAFPQKQINAFVDDKLKKGDDISDSLVEAIEGSSILLVIFSENYVSSCWCLAELVKIIDCKEKYGHIVIPVFYGVDPTEVRHQKKSYEFAELEKKYELSKVQMWRDALKKSANLSGFKSLDFGNDAVLVEEITKVVLMRLSKLKNSPVNSKELVGIDKSISHLKSLLKKESEKVRVIGIWGMGGIGKTTIAEELLRQNRSEYDGCCFLEKVSEELTRHGMESLKNKLFSKLLAEDVKIDTPNWLSSDIVRRVGRMKVLIVLDDVKDTDQLRKLFGTLDWFRSDSRIILTARDKQVLFDNEVDDDDLYKVGVLDSSEALALFKLNAFKQSHPETEFDEISKRVVNYAQGVPLVLKVLAHMLRGKSKEVWESQLNKLKRLPVQEVDKLMRLSYDHLDRLEKKYFLDIACFFNGLNLKVDYMKLLLRDSDSDDSVAVVLARLEDKALITISEDNVISMHDILQEMGREVVRQESSEHPEKRSRLWNLDEIYDVLKNDKGTDAIRSISLPTMRKLKLSPHVFDKMTNLQFLNFRDIQGFDCCPQGLQSFPTTLKYLHWTCCPLKSFPEKFSAENLVMLDLSGSQLEKLWCGVQDLVNLKEVILDNSKFLKELPDFSKATNLKVLKLRGCTSLTTLSSIKNLTSLRKLDIQECSELLALPVLPSSVEILLVKDCKSLKTVLIPSTVAEQFKENKKRIEFWNCLNLDERSLINIGLNLQINLMKFIHQHLSTLEHYVDYKDNFDSYQALYVYPGSSVPDWFEYKTTTDDMIVDISPHHLSPLLGFVFCFVFDKGVTLFRRMKLEITTITGDGERDDVDIYVNAHDIKSEHVCMVYDQKCSQLLTKKAKDQTRFKIKVRQETGARLWFRLLLNLKLESTGVELKGFGVSPVNHSTYQNLIQKNGIQL